MNKKVEFYKHQSSKIKKLLPNLKKGHQEK